MNSYITEHGGAFNWVLKPQRDGGGHILFGDSITTFLEEATGEEISGYILQKRIDSCFRTGIISNWIKTFIRPLEDELGLFYSILSDNGTIISENEGSALIFSEPYFRSGIETDSSSDTDFYTVSSINLLDK